jgi:hypothetical protein
MHTPSRVGASHRSPRCTVQRRNGEFCDAPAAEDMPFPICTRHAVKLYRHMCQVIEDATSTTEGKLAAAGAVIGGMREAQAKRDQGSVVYYVLVGDMIKIGYTANLPTRLASYPPGRRLLAYEPGGKLEEQRIHNRFERFRMAGNEWYRIEQPIIDRINELRHALGKKPVTLTELSKRL